MKLPFDKIYCLHMAEDKERYESLVQQLINLGINNQVEIWWTCKREVSSKIGSEISTLHNDYYDMLKKKNNNVYASVFNCAFEHYTIVKTSLLRGYKNILVMEDDIKFMLNAEMTEKAFSTLPNDYDLIKFFERDYFFHNKIDLYNGQENIFELVNDKETPTKLYSTVMYAMNRRGMERYIEIMDKSFLAADWPFTHFNDGEEKYNIYFPKYAIITHNDKIPSSIHGMTGFEEFIFKSKELVKKSNSRYISKNLQ